MSPMTPNPSIERINNGVLPLFAAHVERTERAINGKAR